MTIDTFLIGSSATFFIVFLAWWIEWRVNFVKKLIDIRFDSLRDRMHNEDRTYYEHRKSINTRLGVLEEKLGWLDDSIEEAKLEEKKQELQFKIEMLNSDLQFFNAKKKQVKKRSK